MKAKICLLPVLALIVAWGHGCSNSKPVEPARPVDTSEPNADVGSTSRTIHPFWEEKPVKAEEFLNDFAQRARRSLDLPLVRAWALSLLTNEPQRAAIHTADIPQTVRNLEHVGSAFVEIDRDVPSGRGAVYVQWGGGSAYWGLVIATDKRMLERRWLLFEPLSQDVFAFHTVDPGRWGEVSPAHASGTNAP
jgi:hypothetical protein